QRRGEFLFGSRWNHFSKLGKGADRYGTSVSLDSSRSAGALRCSSMIERASSASLGLTRSTIPPTPGNTSCGASRLVSRASTPWDSSRPWTISASASSAVSKIDTNSRSRSIGTALEFGLVAIISRSSVELVPRPRLLSRKKLDALKYLSVYSACWDTPGTGVLSRPCTAIRATQELLEAKFCATDE